MKRAALLTTDNPEAGRVWASALRGEGLEVVVAGSRSDALETARSSGFDLYLIISYNCRHECIDFCRRLRQSTINPILLLAASESEDHVLQAYAAGVDEWVHVPIDPALFLAKVRAWLRRSWNIPATALDPVQAGGFLLDPSRRQLVRPDNRRVKLTNLEFRVLHQLMTHRGEVLTPNEIAERVWGYGESDGNILLKNVIYRLRNKIEQDRNHPRYTETVAGEGYRFVGHQEQVTKS